MEEAPLHLEMQAGSSAANMLQSFQRVPLDLAPEGALNAYAIAPITFENAE